MRTLTLTALATLALGASAHAAIIVSEINPAGSGTAAYGADWFELTNTGPADVDVTGWRVDDNSKAFASALAFRGVTSIAAGKSVVFIEGNTSGSSDATVIANFKTAWFGAVVPAGFVIGSYGGSGIGLGTAGDEINIFDAGGNLVTGVAFGAAPAGATFDNAAGVGGNSGANPTVSTASVVGTNGAFTSPGSNEVGSPGAVPEPAGLALAGIAAAGLLRRRRA